MSAKKRHRAQDYLEYLKGNSSLQERHEMEREMEADPFAREAMEGLEGLDPEQAEKDVLALHGKLRKRLNRRKRIRWYSIAATAASILIVGTVFLQIYDSDPLPEDPQPDVILEERKAEQAFEEDKAATPVPEKQEKSQPEQAEQAEPAFAPEQAPKRESPKEKRAPAPAAEALPEPEPVPEPVPEPKAQVEVQEEAQVEADVETDMETDMEAGAAHQAAPEMARARKGKRTTLDYVMVSKATSADEAALEESLDMSTGLVSGVVLYSEDMQPLPGAKIMVKDAGTGVSADMLGRFSLPVSPDTLHTLLTSFVGMENAEFPARDGEDVRLVLHPDPATLDKIVLAQDGSVAYFNELYRSAEPENGFKSYTRYIKKHLRYPEPSPGDPQEVILSFKLTAEGEISEFIPIRSPGPAFTAEAIRLLSEGPPWRPAASPSGPVDEVVSVRIVFEQ